MFRIFYSVGIFLIMSSTITATDAEEKISLISQEQVNDEFANYALNGDVDNLALYINKKNFPSELINEELLKKIRLAGHESIAKALSSAWSWRFTNEFSLKQEADTVNTIKRLLFSAQYGDLKKVLRGFQLAWEKGLDPTTIINNEGKTLDKVAAPYQSLKIFMLGSKDWKRLGLKLENFFPSWQSLSECDELKNVLTKRTRNKISDDREREDALSLWLIRIQEEILAKNYELFSKSSAPEDIKEILSFELACKIIEESPEKIEDTLLYYIRKKIKDWQDLWPLLNKEWLLTKITKEEAYDADLFSDEDSQIIRLTSPSDYTTQDLENLLNAVIAVQFDTINDLISKGLKLNDAIMNNGLTPALFILKKGLRAYSVALQNNLYWKLFDPAKLKLAMQHELIVAGASE